MLLSTKKLSHKNVICLGAMMHSTSLRMLNEVRIQKKKRI